MQKTKQDIILEIVDSAPDCMSLQVKELAVEDGAKAWKGGQLKPAALSKLADQINAMFNYVTSLGSCVACTVRHAKLDNNTAIFVLQAYKHMDLLSQVNSIGCTLKSKAPESEIESAWLLLSSVISKALSASSTGDFCDCVFSMRSIPGAESISDDALKALFIRLRRAKFSVSPTFRDDKFDFIVSII